MSQAQLYLAELEAEAPATRTIIERVPTDLFKWKPHEKSMEMGYLVLMLVDIPRWITTGLKEGMIDFGTFSQIHPKTTEEMLTAFDSNIAECKAMLPTITDEDLSKMFELRNQGAVLMKSTQSENISSSINHWVHHRGQMSVYLRLNDIAVPSIYGPSADDKTF